MVHWDRRHARQKLLIQILVLFATVVGITAFYEIRNGANGEEKKLTIQEKRSIPMREISGIATIVKDGETRIVLVGDSRPHLFLHGGESEEEELSFRKALLDRFSLCQDEDFEECEKTIKKLTRNWEALATDGEQRFFVLQEHSQSILVLDRSAQTIQKAIHFNFAEAFPEDIAKGSKKFRKNALGEGMLLLKKGHVLIAKESVPTAFVEFGPEGDAPLGVNPLTVLPKNEAFQLSGDGLHIKLKPLHTWMLNAHSKCDISDLALDKDKKLLVLSETCQTISRYD
ncbi:MAG: hypothetical protein AAB288_15395, partial [Acidobacteriota bacterium]